MSFLWLGIASQYAHTEITQSKLTYDLANVYDVLPVGFDPGEQHVQPFEPSLNFQMILLNCLLSTSLINNLIKIMGLFFLLNKWNYCFFFSHQWSEIVDTYAEPDELRVNLRVSICFLLNNFSLKLF